MLFIPYSTDAPIYHLPFATGAIIIANIAIFFATTFQLMIGNVELDSIEWLMLNFDQINPIQWITGSFMHAGPFHLLGNMFFLWAFGVVIEGKIGSIPFVGLYFLITLIDGAAVQIPMFVISGEGGALGASGVIFGLMVIAVIWAPENEMDCFFWIVTVVGTAEVRIIALGIAFIFLQIVFLIFSGFAMSSEMLHMVGVMIGAPIGFYMLRKDMVDCEGWDVVSRNAWLQQYGLLCSPQQRARMQSQEVEIDDPVAAALGLKPTLRNRPPPPAVQPGSLKRTPHTKNPKSPASSAPAGQSSARPTPPKPQASAHPEFNRLSFIMRQSIESGNLITAQQTYHRIEQLKLAGGLSDQLLFRYVSLLGSQQRAIDAMRPLQVIASRNGALADDARLRMALIQIRILRKPELAVQTLGQIVETESTKPEVIAKRDQLLAQAQDLGA